MSSKTVQAITVRVNTENGSLAMTFTGRNAWALNRLIVAGERGCTPLAQPAPRWSGYIHDLRGAGIAIETIRDKHEGAYPGLHGRYVLRSSLEVIKPFGPRKAANDPAA